MNSKGQEVKRQHAATFRQNNPDDPAVVHNKKSDALKQMQARAAQQQQPEPQQKTEPTPAPTPEPQSQEKPVDTRPPSEKKKEKKQEPVNCRSGVNSWQKRLQTSGETFNEQM